MKYLLVFAVLSLFFLGNIFPASGENEDFFTQGATIVGKVYMDENENGRQDEGERGIEGVVIILENGIYVKTGSDGKYSVPNLTSGFHVLELDDWTLPPGIILINETERAKFVNLPSSGMSVLNFRVKEDL